MTARFIALLLMLTVGPISIASEEYFYCGLTNLDGSGEDYARWGKGSDFKWNGAMDRWEWISEYTSQFIYPDGRYEQIARVDYFPNHRGYCNAEMEAMYKQKMAEIKRRHGQ